VLISVLSIDYTKILAIAGYAGSVTGRVGTVDVIDMSFNRGDGCPTIPDFPYGTSGIRASYYDGKIVTCGGEYFEAEKKCYTLGPDLDEWMETDEFPDGDRIESAFSQIDGKLLISGGYGGPAGQKPDYLSSTLVYDGVFFSKGPEMPSTKYYHCQLTLNSTHVFFAGGGVETFVLNWETQEYRVLESAPEPLYIATCGVIQNDRNGLEVVVAEDHDSFVFSFTDLQWRNGPQLPDPIEFPLNAIAPYGFATIGGKVNSIIQSKVYKFDQDLYDWQLQFPSLSVARYDGAAAAVPDNFVNCG